MEIRWEVLVAVAGLDLVILLVILERLASIAVGVGKLVKLWENIERKK